METRLSGLLGAAITLSGIALFGQTGAGPSPPSTSAITASGAAAYNLRIVSDASPDLTDVPSLIHSTTTRWTSNRDKVWALFYWSHVLKRQTTPMVLHGFEVTDPIRNLSDYGFTMCSTISGINQTLYEALGLPHQYWDICNHSVSAVAYDGKFRMVDSSMSNLVTTDDGVSLASVTEAAADDARLVRERSLYSTSPNGFLTGSDTLRSLVDKVNPGDGSIVDGFAKNFCDGGLKFRDYYYNWDAGHRYVLNLRQGESYTRYYRRLGTSADYWVGSESISAPDPGHTFEIDAADKFGLRGNGRWTFSPALTADAWSSAVYRSANIVPASAGGLQPSSAGTVAEVLYKVQAANAIASQKIQAEFARSDLSAVAAISVSLNHGATWTEVAATGTEIGSAVPLAVSLRNEVNGAYETLIRIQMRTDAAAPDGIALTDLAIDTITQVNAKALPKLNVGRNEIFVGAGDQTDTMVLWPDLRGDRWKKDAYDASNIGTQGVSVPRKFTAVAYPAVLSQDAYLIYRMDAPADITRVVYGGRLHNYRAGSYIDFLHSFDGGASWIRSFRLTDVNKPYDEIHYETVTPPSGVRAVLFKYLIHNTDPTAGRAAGLYSVRMEVNHRPASPGPAPLDVTLKWKEVLADRTLTDRSHRQRITGFPFTYVVNVGGSDHPVMESVQVSLADDSDPAPFGYGGGTDPGGQKYVHAKRGEGTNVAVGRPYTFSRAPSGFQNSAGPADTSILTDGVVGAPMTGGISYWWGQCWSAGSELNLHIDLGSAQTVAAFRAHLFGYPFWDALLGQVQDRIEVLTSLDGITFASQGLLETSLWKKNIPINYMLLDTEKATAWNFELKTPPVSARHVRYRITPKRILCASELQVFDRLDYQPFDIRIALPSMQAPPPEPEPPPNVPPSVVLTTPTANASFDAPASIALAADAQDPDGTVQRVEFFAGSTRVGTATQSPFTAAWTNVPGGTYLLTARATDNAGATTTSAAVTVTVRAAPPPPPPPGDAIDEIVLHAAVQPRIVGNWVVTSDATAASGARLQNPNANAAKLTTALAAPAHYFELTFAADAGKAYRLWLRGRALNDSYSNDSVFVQFDNGVDAGGTAIWRTNTTSATVVNLEDCSGCGLQGWGWADNGYGVNTFGPLVYFGTSGTQTIRIQVREDGLAIDQVVLSAVKYKMSVPGSLRNDSTILAATGSGGEEPPPPPPPPPDSSADEIVRYPGVDAQVTGGWSAIADASAAGGTRLENPNANQPKLAGPLANPTQAFELSFTADAGKAYRVWLRGKAVADSYLNDSVFIQFDGSVTQSGAPLWRTGSTSATIVVLEDCSGCALQGWGWADNGYGLNEFGPLVYFGTSGPQRMRIQVREDGLAIDQVVLSAVKYLTARPGATKNDTVVLPK